LRIRPFKDGGCHVQDVQNRGDCRRYSCCTNIQHSSGRPGKAKALLELHLVGSDDLKAGKNADPDRAVALGIMEALQAFNESAQCQL